MTKANGQDDQGEVTGNRYGISKVSRAPEWEPFAQSELGTMGKLITEMHKMTMLAYGHLFEERDRLKHELTVFSKEHKGTRIAIGKKLEKVRSLIREIPNATSIRSFSKENTLSADSWDGPLRLGGTIRINLLRD